MKRYSLVEGKMEPDREGEWVRWPEVGCPHLEADTDFTTLGDSYTHLSGLNHPIEIDVTGTRPNPSRQHQCEICTKLSTFDALLAALAAVEWGGEASPPNCETSQPGSRCCPVCYGVDPAERPDGPPLAGDWAEEAYGHQPDCMLAAALAKARTSQPDP